VTRPDLNSFFGLLNALPLPPKTLFRQAAATTKLADAPALSRASAATTVPFIFSRHQRRCHRRHFRAFS
jgi:hypothetical protein